MPSQTVAGPGGGTITINYGSTANSAQVAQFAGSVSQFISTQPPANIQSFPNFPFVNQPVTGTVAFLNGEFVAGPIQESVPESGPGSFLLSAATQAVVIQNNGSDTITGGGNTALTILSGTGALTYTGPSGNTTIVAGGGGNHIDFQSGLSNAAYLNSGSNTVTSDSGNATISAGTGGNLIVVGSGTANIISTGSDTVIAGSGSDTINVRGTRTASPATATTWSMAAPRGCCSSTARARSTVYGQYSASDTMYAGAGGGIYVGGTGGNNALVGGSGAATLYGGGAGDTLYAGSGNSALVAGYGAETLVAGSGSDTFTGGSGPDLFSFTNGQAGGADMIYNFNTAEDHVTLQGYSGGASAALSTASISNGSETLTLSDGTKVTFSGVTNLSGSNFI